MVEPARHLADELARAGQPVWLYRFAYVSESQRGELTGTLHGMGIPYTWDLPGALVGEDAVTQRRQGDGGARQRLLGEFGKTAIQTAEAGRLGRATIRRSTVIGLRVEEVQVLRRHRDLDAAFRSQAL